jgi:alkylated DNA repair dioxygenase AlkB
MSHATADLFSPAQAEPAGFDYLPDIIDRAEEAELMAQIAPLEFAPYEFRGVSARRRVIAFGFHHDYQTRRLGEAPEIPGFLHGLRSKVAAFAKLQPADFVQTLVSEYTPGTPIGWHRDRDHYGTIAGVSLLSSATLRFRTRGSDRWLRAAQIVEPRSAYILSGAARASWQHSIPAVTALRYSITFRTMAKDQAPVAHGRRPPTSCL